MTPFLRRLFMRRAWGRADAEVERLRTLVACDRSMATARHVYGDRHTTANELRRHLEIAERAVRVLRPLVKRADFVNARIDARQPLGPPA